MARKVGLPARSLLHDVLSTNLGMLITRRRCVMRPPDLGGRRKLILLLCTWTRRNIANTEHEYLLDAGGVWAQKNGGHILNARIRSNSYHTT